MGKQTEDFRQASLDYVDGDPEGAQKIVAQVGYEMGCEYSYQYAVDKACEYLYDWNKKQAEKHGSKAVLGIREFTISVSDFRKAMED